MDKLLLYILLAVGLSLVLTMLALIDIIKKDFGSTRAKVAWHFVVLVPLIGWLIYLVFGFRKGTRKTFS
ncbi:PLDc N-terminal domain-containing protein [Desulfospira joergensenii]|uniref:PLDc N-terminal domain-containing protein n=1 Tax=Desulfospira joergensenii TaxID=53329 RepID=UPI0003B69F6A|nr:PLDc N-terminal domain-containing protein [Desulfospira joergensenii]